MRIFTIEEIETAYNTWYAKTKVAIESGIANHGTKHEFDFNFVRCANGTIPERAQKDYERQYEQDRSKATPMVICSHCGKPESLTYYKDVQDKMLASGYCHTCHFWSERVEQAKGHSILITEDVGGDLGYFSCGKATSPFGSTSCNGFSGHEWKVTFNDERGTMYTNNMWHGGDIDYLWRDQFVKNGERVGCGRPEYIEWWLNGRSDSHEFELLIKRVMYEVSPPATKEVAEKALKAEGYNTYRAGQRIKNERGSSGEGDTHHS